MRQVHNVCTSPAVQRAWEEGKILSVHGFLLHIEDGTLVVSHPFRKPLRRLLGPIVMENSIMYDERLHPPSLLRFCTLHIFLEILQLVFTR